LPREVAEETGTLFAGNICNTNVYESGNEEAARQARAMFEEQVGWAVEAGVDFVIGETFSYAEEALIALEVVKQVRSARRDNARLPPGAGYPGGMVRGRVLQATG
jgi:betaine-homocysteine S-methyltransferase